ncbi:hypothetical protein Q1695_006590 [Nippostrongylus brasiliensis]|nr:hypothetical protein Q1695_006590 [Nippostrongylus brasiliensis]
MFSTPGSSGVHVVSIGDSKGVKRLRVNVIYERRSGAGSSPVAEEVDSPPQIDFEGYGDEIPEWGGIEQEVSSGHANWNEDDIGDGVFSMPKSPPSVVPTCSFWETKRKRGSQCSDASSSDQKRKSLRISCSKYTAKAYKSPPQGLLSEGVCTSIDRKCYGSSRSRLFSDTNFTTKWTAFCRLCRIHVKSTHRRLHISTCHLRRSIYKCPLCDVSSTYHLSNIRVHIRNVHHVTAEPISLKSYFENDMNAFLYSCFGDHRIFKHQDPEVVACLNAILNCVSRNEKPGRCDASTDGTIYSYDVSTTVPNGVVSNPSRIQARNVCQLCFESNVKHLERHVLQKHVKLPMFLCPYCSFSSCYSPASVKEHIKVRHAMSEPVPLDIRMDYAEHIRTTYNQCFDDNSGQCSRIAFKQHS